MAGALELLLPRCVATAEATVDPPDAMLFPEEQAVVVNAVEKRRREFTTVRVCARAALAALGLPPTPILPGLRGAPGWPAGIVGSMTHCAGYRAAAAARAAEVATIGIDAEPNQPLPEGVLEAIAAEEERAWVSRLAGDDGQVCWDRLLFSAKESVFKAWFPLTRQWLDFDQAAVTVDPSGGTFTARLLVAGPVLAGQRLTGFSGRWLVRDGLVVTSVAVRA